MKKRLIHVPYDLSKNELRLVRFDGSTTITINDGQEDILSCNVDVYNLDSYSNEYLECRRREPQQPLTEQVEEHRAHVRLRYQWGDYVAFSYSQEPHNPPQKIMVNGKVIEVGYNLALGLRAMSEYLKHRQDSLMVWVDVLCIDQENQAEMERDLKRMSFILSHARDPVSYAGPEASNSHLVMRRLDDFKDRSLESLDTVSVLEGISEQEWIAIVDFLQRPYWRRMWVVQEMILTKNNNILLCGIDVSRLASLWRLANLIVHNATLVQRLISAALKDNNNFEELRRTTFTTCARLCSMQAVRTAFQQQNDCDITEILNICQLSLQHDARSNAYSNRDSLPSSISDLAVQDLNRSDQAIHRDLATAIITATDRLDILQYCDFSAQRHPSLPTWTPNLMAQSLYHPLRPRSSIYADENRNSEAYFSLDGNHLICQGVVIDEIDHLTPEQESILPTSMATRKRQFSETQPLASYGTKLNFETVREALWRTLVADGEGSNSPNAAPKQYQVLLDLPWPVRGFDGHLNCGIISLAAEFIDAGWITPNERQDLTTFLDFRVNTTRGFDVCGYSLGSFFSHVHITGQIPTPKAHSQRDNAQSNGEAQRQLRRHLKYALGQASHVMRRRRLAITRCGLIGAAARSSCPGDLIVVLYGCNTPVVLRPVTLTDQPALLGTHRSAGIDAGGSTLHYMVMGDCYVHGFMHGEAFSAEGTRDRVKNFALCSHSSSTGPFNCHILRV